MDTNKTKRKFGQKGRLNVPLYQKKKNDVCNFKKKVLRKNLSPLKIETALNYEFTVLIDSKND